jgi:mycothiol S-conjugate amidase
LRAHKTQVDEKEPFWFGLSDEELATVFPFEDWVLARSLVPSARRDGDLEDDLFDGIRSPVRQS